MRNRAPRLSPSATGSVPPMRVRVSTGGSSANSTSKPFPVACGSAPPPTLVPRPARSKPFAPVPSGPSAILSRPAPLAAVGTNSSAAVRAPAPEKRSTGASVSVPESAAPVPLFTESVWPPARAPLPDIASGTSTVSPAISARPSVTVNATASPAPTAPAPTRARLTTVGSLSRMESVTLFEVTVAPFLAYLTTAVSTPSGSSMPSFAVIKPEKISCPTCRIS